MNSNLEIQQDAFLKLIIEHYKIEMTENNVRTEQEKLQDDLRKVLNAHKELEKLRPLATEQETLEKMRDDKIEQFANIRVKENQIRSLDEKINDLRGKFIKNKEQIKEAEAKTEVTKNIEADKYLAMIFSALKAREAEIADEGKNLKYEKENLLNRIGDKDNIQNQLTQLETKLKKLGNPKSQIWHFETQIKNELSIREKLSEVDNTLNKLEIEKRINSEILKKYRLHTVPDCKVGSKCLRLAEFMFSSKTCNEIFYQMVGDWREDYLIALQKGRIFDAMSISVRNYFTFAYTIILYSKLGKLLEFIFKIAEIVEFFNRFSK